MQVLPKLLHPSLGVLSVLALTPLYIQGMLQTPGSSVTPDFVAPWNGFETADADEGRTAQAVRIADLDGDGITDAVVLHGATIPRLSVLLGVGAGRLAPPVYYDTADNSLFEDVLDFELGDLDGDGDVDVAVSSAGSGGSDKSVHLHLNRGDGTFSPYTKITTGGPPVGIALADYDGDGLLDIATANYGFFGFGSTISVLRNLGSGFAAPVSTTVPLGPFEMRAADLNGDGAPDLAIACNGMTLSILINTGTGAFTRTDYSIFAGFAGDVSPCVETGDFDGDGDLDVFYSSNKTGTTTGLGAIGLLFNDGSGALAPPVRIDTTAPSQGAVSMAVGDWNGDGALDLAAAHLFGSTWTLVEGDGSGGFSTRFIPSGLDYVIDVQSGDLNGDGIEELLFIQEHGLTLDVWRNDGQGAFAAPPTTAFATPGFFADAKRMEVADLEGDGDLDVVAATTSFGSGEISILRNAGDGTYLPAQLIAVTPDPGSIRLGDLNGDGLVDIGWGDQDFPGEFHTVLATGPASFGAVTDWTLFGYDIGDFAFLDLDNDGDLDLAVVTDDPFATGQFITPLTLALNDGTGSFGAPYTHDLSDLGDRIAVADVDNDGLVDVITNTGFGGLEVCLSKGDGSLGVRLLAPTNSSAEDITLADFDQDGLLDIATANLGDGNENTMSISLGSGNGLFSLPTDYTAAYHLTEFHEPTITAGDVDGDGDIDLVLGNEPSSDISLYRNLGDGTFAAPLRYGVGGPAFDVVLADATGDGILDCLTGFEQGVSPSLGPALVVLEGTGATPWRDLGFALAGSNGTPSFQGISALVGGGSFDAQLTNAIGSSSGVLLVSTSRIDLPLFGGTLVPAIELLFGVTTDAAGVADVSVPWPSGLPFGFEVYSQVWLFDSGSVNGRFSASNALVSIQF